MRLSEGFSDSSSLKVGFKLIDLNRLEYYLWFYGFIVFDIIMSIPIIDCGCLFVFGFWHFRFHFHFDMKMLILFLSFSNAIR